MSRILAKWMRSSYRKGKYPSQSSNVRNPRCARISARRGPTPFRYISSDAGVTDISCLYHAAVVAQASACGVPWLTQGCTRCPPEGGRYKTPSALAINRSMRKDGSLNPPPIASAPKEACLPLERLDRKDAK